MITFDGLIAKQNPELSDRQGWVGWQPQAADYPKDGPRNARVEIVNGTDFENNLLIPLQFVPASVSGKTYSKYHVKKNDLTQRHRESLFATILRTLDLVEDREALGRRVRWQFGDTPLRIHPYCQTDRGAFYDRIDQCLQFGYLQAGDQDASMVFTCASPDIIAHETAHAIVDGIAPDLFYNLSVEPQAAALHEAIADLTAVFLTFEMKVIRKKVIEDTGGNLLQPTELGWIAEEFGAYDTQNKLKQYLRNLWSEATFDVTSSNYIDPQTQSVHDLSTVFSSAVYEVMLREYDRIQKEWIKPDLKTKAKQSLQIKALFSASTKIRKMLFRAIDYLPMSHVITFSTLAKVIHTADLNAYPRPEDAFIRDTLKRIFIERKIIRGEREFKAEPITYPELFSTMFRDELLNDTITRNDFIGLHRHDIGIPQDRPVLSSAHKRSKFIFMPDSKSFEIDEIVLKVSWVESVRYNKYNDFSQKLGKTFVIDPDSLRIKNVFTAVRDLAPYQYNGEFDEPVAKKVDKLIDEAALPPLQPVKGLSVEKHIALHRDAPLPVGSLNLH